MSSSSGGSPIKNEPKKKMQGHSESPALTRTTADDSRWFVILLAVVLIGLGTSIYFTISNEYVPVNKRTIFTEGSDIQSILTIEDNMQIPLQKFFDHKKSNIILELYFKDSKTNTLIKDVKLSSNGSSILTLKNDTLEQDKRRAGTYEASLEVGHPLLVKTYSEPYSVEIYYRKGNDTGPLKVEKIPFTWSSSTLDFGKLSYFWIVFLGVLFSRVFTFSQSSDGESKISTHFHKLELLWVPFSAVITLLIFSSFTDKVHPGSDVLTNLALAFGFGFGFDKIFEIWAKSPNRGEHRTTESKSGEGNSSSMDTSGSS
jgi:hypothetical protein